MIRRLVLTASFLALAACGQESSSSASDAPATPAPAAPAAPAPSEAQMQAALAALPAPYNAADLENGRRAFARCRSCHTITPGGPNMTGPNLWGVFGRKAGTHPGFNYSKAVQEADITWDGERIDHWLENPRTFLPGNKMSFAGLPDADDRRDLVAWLQINTTAPTP
jgi:cytochrome c